MSDMTNVFSYFATFIRENLKGKTHILHEVNEGATKPEDDRENLFHGESEALQTKTKENTQSCQCW